MTAWISFVLLALLSLNGCSNKEEPATSSTSASTTPIALAPAPNSGRILQLLQAAGYTYAEVKTSADQTVWIAGGPLQLKVGDSVQWGDYAVMRNFSSKALGRTFDQILFVNAWGAPGGVATHVAPHGVPTDNPLQRGSNQQIDATNSGQGKVNNVAVAGGYTYIEIEQNSSTIWIAAPRAAVKVGERISWNGGAMMQNFAAKELGRTFDKIIFVGSIAVVE